MKSILQDEKKCYFCSQTDALHLHHVYPGTGKRKISDDNGFTVYLCWKCHREVHNDRMTMQALQKECQRKYEKSHTREEFIKLVGRNYLAER